MPVLLAFKGLPGSGKSTLAQALSCQLRWPLLDQADMKASLVGSGSTADAPAYATMLAIARRQLLQGPSVICDSPLLKLTYETARRLAAETQGQLRVIECSCSEEALWRRRLEGRRQDALVDGRIADWDALLSYRSRRADTDYATGEPHLLVDTASAQACVLTLCINWLRAADATLR